MLWHLILFLFTIPIRIYERLTKRVDNYTKEDAMSVALINAIFIFIVNSAYTFPLGISYIIIPILFSVLAFGVSYSYLLKSKDAKAKKDFDKKADIICKSCDSFLPNGASECKVCGRKIASRN